MLFLVFLFTNLLCAASQNTRPKSTTKRYDYGFTAKDVGKCCERYTENGSPAERLVPCGLYPSRVCADIQFQTIKPYKYARPSTQAICSLPDWAYRCCSGEDAGCAGKGDGDTCHDTETDDHWYTGGKCEEHKIATLSSRDVKCVSGITTNIQCKGATEISKYAVESYTLFFVVLAAAITLFMYCMWAIAHGRCCPCKASGENDVEENDIEENDIEENGDEETFRPLKQPQQLPVGTAVYALWTDGATYSAKVTWCDPQGCFFTVKYDDKDEQRHIKFDCIHLITPVEPVGVESTNGFEVVMEMTPITQTPSATTTANVTAHPVTSIPVATRVDSVADDNTAQFCPKCGMKRQEGHNFCPKCGTDMSIIVV